jgi:hypothetical protein
LNAKPAEAAKTNPCSSAGVPEHLCDPDFHRHALAHSTASGKTEIGEFSIAPSEIALPSYGGARLIAFFRPDPRLPSGIAIANTPRHEYRDGHLARRRLRRSRSRAAQFTARPRTSLDVPSRRRRRRRLELALTGEDREYELRAPAEWNPTGLQVERFDDAMTAFQRHAMIERQLRDLGWSLDEFQSEGVTIH